MAEDLHDSIAPKLSGIKMKIEYVMGNIKDEYLIEAMDESLASLKFVINEVRELSHHLHSSTVKLKGLRNNLEELIADYNTKNGCRYQLLFNFEEIDDQYSFEWIVSLYRVIAELLYNIHKHAKAKEAIVQLSNFDSIIQLIVEDNGKGFNPNERYEGIGLRNIKKRLLVIGAKLNIDSSENGTTVIIEIPNKTNEYEK
ncbi:MAG: histidine kinase [Bacteroidetes bacterium]|nr:histidine kinase [Bacteroidota bacterium]